MCFLYLWGTQKLLLLCAQSSSLMVLGGLLREPVTEPALTMYHARKISYQLYHLSGLGVFYFGQEQPEYLDNQHQEIQYQQLCAVVNLSFVNWNTQKNWLGEHFLATLCSGLIPSFVLRSDVRDQCVRQNITSYYILIAERSIIRSLRVA